jgi:hypothetical protein
MQEERTAIHEALQELAGRIEKYQWEGGPFDEWEDSNTCSLIREAESPTLGPLFREYLALVDRMEAARLVPPGALGPVEPGPPRREVRQGTDEQLFVRYYFSGEQLQNLAREVRRAIQLLLG